MQEEFTPVCPCSGEISFLVPFSVDSRLLVRLPVVIPGPIEWHSPTRYRKSMWEVDHRHLSRQDFTPAQLPTGLQKDRVNILLGELPLNHSMRVAEMVVVRLSVPPAQLDGTLRLPTRLHKISHQALHSLWVSAANFVIVWERTTELASTWLLLY